MVAERGHRRGPGLSLQSRDRAWDASESLTRAGQRRYANAGQREAPQVCAPGLRRSLSWMLANPKRMSEVFCKQLLSQLYKNDFTAEKSNCKMSRRMDICWVHQANDQK
uniref:Uncharacterized protein n=1 Tax=Rangifer tarandus platyrhynchus TaxID=3082113 RepID=A0ACB0E361_RANTA|nr:unnamed protein product [Rangifer tarandus platyrhynchus]